MTHAIDSTADFDEALESSNDKLVVIDCWAEWNGPCRAIAPVFTALSNDNPEVGFYKVDIDAVSDVAENLGVRSIPTFYFFRNGEKIAEVVGANPHSLRESIAQHK